MPHKHNFNVILVFDGVSNTIFDGKMFFSATVKIILASHSSTRITKIVLGLKCAFLKILPNAVLIDTVSRMFGNLRKMHFETSHHMTKIAVLLT